MYKVSQVRTILHEGTDDLDMHLDVMGAVKRLPQSDQDFLNQHLYNQLKPYNDQKRTMIIARKIVRILNG